MAGPSAKARLRGTERYREQVLPQPLAKGIAPDEVRHYLANRCRTTQSRHGQTTHFSGLSLTKLIPDEFIAWFIETKHSELHS